MKKQGFRADADIRSPYKLLFFTAFAAPALNNLIFGWGMLWFSFQSMNHPELATASAVCGVIYRVLRSAALGCTIITLGYHAAKGGFRKTILPTVFCAGAAMGATAVSVLIFAIMLACGMTDASSYTPFADRFWPYVGAAALDVAVLFAIEALCALFFSLTPTVKTRRETLHLRSPFMITAYVLFAIYTFFTMSEPISAVKSYDGSGSFFVSCILPFLATAAYGLVMLLSAILFRAVLRRYFGREGTAR